MNVTAPVWGVHANARVGLMATAQGTLVRGGLILAFGISMESLCPDLHMAHSLTFCKSWLGSHLLNKNPLILQPALQPRNTPYPLPLLFLTFSLSFFFLGLPKPYFFFSP